MKKVIYTVKTEDKDGNWRFHYGAKYKKAPALEVLKEAGLEIVETYEGLYEMDESKFAIFAECIGRSNESKEGDQE